MNNKKFFLSIS